MSNKDTSNEASQKKSSNVDMFQKEEMHLFSYELLKSKKMFAISPTNSFNYEFIVDKDIIDQPKNNNEPKMKVNNRTISIIDEENNSSLKTLNIEVPSAKKLSQRDFQTNFLKDYDTSFASFCGVNKDQYENIYIKNNYTPIIDNFGDIKINIKNIIEVLNEFPTEVKINNKKSLKYKFKKILKSNKKNKDSAKKLKFPFKTRLLKKLNKKNKISPLIKTPMKSIINISNNSSANSNRFRRNNLAFNIKDKGKGLSICIPKEKNNNINLNNNRNILNIGGNKTFPNLKIPNKAFTFQMGNVINKNILPNISNIPNINTMTINSVLSNSRQHSSNDIFNFSNRDIRNYLNLSNINNPNIFPTLSPNIPILTPIISPFPISPYPNIFSAHLNNSIIPDATTFNNNIINPNSFIFPNNSPAMINININNNYNLNNNIVNGNILNNNIGGQNAFSKINNSNNNVS